MDVFFPLQLLADRLIYGLGGLNPESHLGTALNFFVYDSLKILLLLLAINFLMAAVRHYLPTERLRDFLASRRWYGADYFMAALFGTVTPFCSCSSIPLFVGFLGAGIPLGVTMSFLITSPLVNQVAVALFIGLFGWKMAALYVLSAVMLGAIGGFMLNRLKLEKYVLSQVWQMKIRAEQTAGNRTPFRGLLVPFWREGLDLTLKIAPYVLIGIGIGAAIHGYVPSGFFERYVSSGDILAVPIATLAAVPMYANAVGVIPIMQSLVEKGVPLGTALAFMMAVVGLSLPEALILKRVMAFRLLACFFGITAMNIMVIGFLFNAFAA